MNPHFASLVLGLAQQAEAALSGQLPSGAEGMADPRMVAQTLIDKIWSMHEIVRRDDGASLLWVDRHYVHEGSFHAFSQMKTRGRTVAEPTLTFGVADHYVPTRGRDGGIANPEIAAMVRTLCGPDMRYVTGQSIHVNGGNFMP